MKLLAVVVAVVPVAAHADEPDCPLDMYQAAGGTWSTMIARTIDACLSDPACASEAGMAARPPSPPPPSGRFADAGGMLGVRSDSRTIDRDTRETDAWLVGSGGVHAGWRRGLQACAAGRGAVGTESQIESRFGVAFPWTFVSVAIGGGQRWQVRPALSSPRVWLRRAFVENSFHAQMSFATWRHRSGAVSAVVPFRVETSARQQLDGAPDPGVSQRAALSFYEHVGDGKRFEVVRFAFDHYHPDGLPPEGMTTGDPMRRPAIGVVRIDPFTYVGRAFGFDIELDVGYLDGELDCAGCAPVGATVAIGDASWQARYDRDAYLAYDARITVEDRLSARFRHVVGRHAFRVDGFAALTRTTVDRTPVATGGATVGVDSELGHGIVLAVDAEAGRSFYARFDGDPEPVAEPVARLGVTLLRRFGY